MERKQGEWQRKPKALYIGEKARRVAKKALSIGLWSVTNLEAKVKTLKALLLE